MQTGDVLRRVRFLAEASEESIEFLAARAVSSRLARGEFLWHQGDPCIGIWVIVSGSIAAVHTTPDGDQLIYRIAGPYESPGHVDIIDGAAREVSARATRPSEVLALSAADVRHVLDTDPAVVFGLLRDTTAIVRILQETAADLAHADLTHRLAKLLLSLADEDRLGLTQGELAAHLAAARQSVNSRLRMLTDSGLVRLAPGGAVAEIDRAGLRAVVTGR